MSDRSYVREHEKAGIDIKGFIYHSPAAGPCILSFDEVLSTNASFQEHRAKIRVGPLPSNDGFTINSRESRIVLGVYHPKEVFDRKPMKPNFELTLEESFEKLDRKLSNLQKILERQESKGK